MVRRLETAPHKHFGESRLVNWIRHLAVSFFVHRIRQSMTKGASMTKKKTTKSELTQEIPWKYLPVVLLLLAIPALPAIMTRDSTREAAQDARIQNEMTIADYKREIADGALANSTDLTRDDAECVADVVVDAHGIDGIREHLSSGQTLYTETVKSRMLSECEVE